MVQLTDAWRRQYETLFATMLIRPNRVSLANSVANKIKANQARYTAVSERTNGVPWFFIGTLHYREASLDFTKFLGDGEPLSRASINVPAHMGPFRTFEDGGVAALIHEGFQRVTDWSLGSILFLGEEYNGEGYHIYHRDVPTPYVWAGSTVYVRGKYSSDGHYDPYLIDQQLGIAVILASMQKLGFISLAPAIKAAA